jgi:5,10-methylenetetrahydrofolate reductase
LTTGKGISPLEEKLRAGEFVITAEIAPPHGTDVGAALETVSSIAGVIDAVNVTDNQNSRLKLSSLVFSHIMYDRGYEVIFQLACRDRNRLALQSDLLGAWSLGIRNILAISGDHITAGGHPETAAVFDLDSIQLLSVISSMNSGSDMSGKSLSGSPDFFPGAALACENQPTSLQLMRFRKKIGAGARFFQTQAIFDPSNLEAFMRIAEKEGVFILSGILLLHSPSMIDFVNRKIPGLRVPEEVTRRIASAADPLEAGIEEAARQIREFRNLGHGVHLMTPGREKLVPEILERAGLI